MSKYQKVFLFLYILYYIVCYCFQMLQILNMISDDIMNSQSTFRNTIDQANHIKIYYNSGKMFLQL